MNYFQRPAFIIRKILVRYGLQSRLQRKEDHQALGSSWREIYLKGDFIRFFSLFPRFPLSFSFLYIFFYPPPSPLLLFPFLNLMYYARKKILFLISMLLDKRVYRYILLLKIVLELELLNFFERGKNSRILQSR